jgi:hypothetical protein
VLAGRHCDDAKSGLRDKQIDQPGVALLPFRVRIAFVVAAGLAAAVGGCSNGTAVLDEIKEGNYLQKPVVHLPDWASRERTVELGPSGPVGPEDLVNAAGECAPAVQAAKPDAPEAAPAQAASAPAEPQAPPPAGKPQFGSLAGDLAGAPMAQAPAPAAPPPRLAIATPGDRLQPEGFPSAAPVLGGIALGMTECQAVRRAGRPTQVAIGSADGERKTVVTYLSGPWPGIYTFVAGRLKVVDAAPAPPKPTKPQKKKRRAPAHTAASDRVSVR